MLTLALVPSHHSMHCISHPLPEDDDALDGESESVLDEKLSSGPTKEKLTGLRQLLKELTATLHPFAHAAKASSLNCNAMMANPQTWAVNAQALGMFGPPTSFFEIGQSQMQDPDDDINIRDVTSLFIYRDPHFHSISKFELDHLAHAAEQFSRLSSLTFSVPQMVETPMSSLSAPNLGTARAIATAAGLVNWHELLSESQREDFVKLALKSRQR